MDAGKRLVLPARTARADLARSEGEKVRCLACGHRCLLGEGAAGVCRVRFVSGRELRAPWGYVASVALDPVEKKPFFHLLPGSKAFSFGMLGCDLRCPYCQNWEISQAGRDPESARWVQPRDATPEELAAAAVSALARIVVSTYNEPLVTVEWGVAVFREARARGLATAIVSNGHGTPEVVSHLLPWVDGVKIDLKSMRDESYRLLGGRLGPVLETIRGFHNGGAWVEVVTLVVPGLNDGEDELREIAQFLVSVSADIPWHVTAFHPDYRWEDRPATPAATLERACLIGGEEGLRFVYAGNLPGRLAAREETRCPRCRRTLVARRGFSVLSCSVLGDGACPACGERLAGRWSAARLTSSSVPA